PRILALGRGHGYTYALGDATNLYNARYYHLTGVRHASRSIVWLQPDVIVVYDRADTARPGFKRFWLQLPAPAQVSGRQATVRTPGRQKLIVTSLLPVGATVGAQGPPVEDSPANEEPMKFRLRVAATGDPRSARFLHVLQ